MKKGYMGQKYFSKIECLNFSVLFDFQKKISKMSFLLNLPDRHKLNLTNFLPQNLPPKICVKKKKPHIKQYIIFCFA